MSEYTAESQPLMLQRIGGGPSLRRLDSALPGSVRGVAKPSKGGKIVVVDSEGQATYTTLRKQALVTELQLRHRDIRALDPAVQLPYPSAIFIRKQALVLNLEGLKLIIGRDKTLVISVPSLTDLSARLLPDLNNPVVVRLSNHIAAARLPFSESAGMDGYMSADELNLMEALPYELRALEAALLMVLKILQHEVQHLESVTHPVLARIRRSVARPDLEQLYEIQNRLDKTISRAAKIKEILEELLDDELQMAGLCLSKVEGMSPTASASSAAARRADSRGELEGAKSEQMAEEADEMSEAEDLIESYWLQVDSALSRLKILQERITNTEHLVNLDLDSKRNALVALSLAVDLVLMMFEIHMAVTGIFGMNLTSGLERWDPYSLWGVVSVGLVLGLTAMLSFGFYAKRKGILNVPAFGLERAAGTINSSAGAMAGGLP